MANATNDYNYAVTDSGAAIGNTVSKLDKPAGVPYKVYNLNNDSRSETNGIALSDFSDSNSALVGLPFKTGALDGTLLGAINTQFAQGAGGFNYSNWDPTNTYVATYNPTAGYYPSYVFYKTSVSVNIYKCISAISSPSAVTPDVDTTHWQYVSQAFKMRLIPAENSYIPDTSGGERFKHYITCYAPYIDGNIFYPNWYIWIVGKGYQTYYGSNGLENAVVTDGTTSSNNMIVSGVSGTWSTNTVSFTHPDSSYVKLIGGSKVRVRGLTVSGTPIPFTVNVTSSTTTGFTGTIASLGTYSAGTAYIYGDFVTYTTGGNTSVYYHYSTSTTTGTVPTSTGTWKKVVGTISSGTADTIFSKWTLYLDTNFLQAAVEPVPAGSTSSSKAKPRHTINSFVYNEHIVNQKQTLFSTGDYIIHDGFPFDKDSITGGTMNITAGILPDAISSATRPSVTTTDTESLPQSDNRWIAISGNISNWAYPANTNLVWTSRNGSTTRTLKAFNDADHTYLPELLDGFDTSNQSGTTSQLMLMSPDTSTPPMSASRSLSFANKDFLYTGFNPFKINGSSSNAFTSLVVAYLDYVPGTVMSATLGAEETNWYGIMSEAVFSASPTLETDVATLNTYTQYQPRLSVRYKYDGTITLNLGDTLLTGIKAKNGIARPFQPVIIGLTVEPPDASGMWSTTLTVVDTDINRATVKFKRNWLGYSAETHNVMLYGATPFNKRWHGAKMYIMEINNYYSSKTNQFFNNEIKTIDKMYAVTSGRVS